MARTLLVVGSRYASASGGRSNLRRSCRPPSRRLAGESSATLRGSGRAGPVEYRGARAGQRMTVDEGDERERLFQPVRPRGPAG